MPRFLLHFSVHYRQVVEAETLEDAKELVDIDSAKYLESELDDIQLYEP